MEQSLKPTTLRERIADAFITGVRQNVWSQAAGLAFADRILAMFAKQDPGYRDTILHPKGAWFIPGTLILLGWEWSWSDTWLTPHIGLTTFENYRTLRVGWLAFAAGIAWPTKRTMQQAQNAPSRSADLSEQDRADIIHALRQARSAFGEYPFFERATALADRLEKDA